MAIELNVSVKVSWEDLRKLSPQQCDAFMRGVAQIVSADSLDKEGQRTELSHGATVGVTRCSSPSKD